MKKYTVLLERSAERALHDLPRRDLRLISESLDALGSEPRPRGAKKLLKPGGYRIRKGKYRILFTVDDSARVVGRDGIYTVGSWSRWISACFVTLDC